MDFSIPERMHDILGAVRDLLVREVVPLEPALLSKPFSELIPEQAAVRQEGSALGFLGLRIFLRSHGGHRAPTAWNTQAGW